MLQLPLSCQSDKVISRQRNSKRRPLCQKLLHSIVLHVNIQEKREREREREARRQSEEARQGLQDTRNKEAENVWFVSLNHAHSIYIVCTARKEAAQVRLIREEHIDYNNNWETGLSARPPPPSHNHHTHNNK